MLKDQQTNIQPGSDATVWSIVAQGDTAAVLTTRGDMITQNDGGVTRLPIGLPGSTLTKMILYGVEHLLKMYYGFLLVV